MEKYSNFGWIQGYLATMYSEIDFKIVCYHKTGFKRSYRKRKRFHWTQLRQTDSNGFENDRLQVWYGKYVTLDIQLKPDYVFIIKRGIQITIRIMAFLRDFSKNFLRDKEKMKINQFLGLYLKRFKLFKDILYC